MYYLLALSILTSTANSSTEQMFAQLARQTNLANADRVPQLLRNAELYVKKGVTSDELSFLHDQLKDLYRKGKYRECAAVGMKMAKMLPKSSEDYIFGQNSVEVSSKKTEKSEPKEVPFVRGTFLQALWVTGVGDMFALDNDYVEALRTYEVVRAFKSPAKSKDFREVQTGKGGAFLGAALMNTILSHRTQALKLIQEAPGIDPSWCGTCQWGHDREADLQRAVYDAATLSGAKAEVALMQILKTGYKPKKLWGDDPASHEENLEIKVNAAFLLGEIYLRRGDIRLASAAFRSVTGYESSDLSIMAKSRLRKLNASNRLR